MSDDKAIGPIFSYNSDSFYERLLRDTMMHGEDTFNDRTGKTCRAINNVTIDYSGADDCMPLVTTRKSAWRMAITEKLGYMRGWNSAADFRNAKCPTWDANANLNKAWLANDNRKGEDDMGRVYGVQGREWSGHDGNGPIDIDQLANVVAQLRTGKDDRGTILTYWNPGEMALGCLRPCMHTYTFSISRGTLHVHVLQRSIH